ncbi:hypothetical protein SAMN04487896_1709 [Paenibacillus sp. ov031]|nr:hypothetical protein SAMN04487896_1709 [Paenibacillus sp. ov031]
MRKVLNIFVSCTVICILTLNLSALVNAEPNTVNEEEFKPLSLTLLNPSIQMAITQYYQKIQKPQPSYGLVHTILQMRRSLLHSTSIHVRLS